MNSLLVKNGYLVTLETPNRVLQAHALAIRGDEIERIAPVSDFDESEFDQVLDASGKVVMPGLINAHMHFYSSFAAGLSKAEPAADFGGVLRNLWWRLDRRLSLEDCYYSALVASIEAIRHGTTTIVDHHASPKAVDGSLKRIGEAVRAAGLRASLCYEVSDRDGAEIAAEGIVENISFIKENDRQGLLHGMVGLHASFTVEATTLQRAAEAARDLGTGCHIHVAEDELDQRETVARHQLRVVDRLHRAGVLGPQTICAHCVHVTAAERALLAETGTIVTHQPQSNMNNGVGVFDLAAFSEAGVQVGLGTDAMTNNMLEELRAAIWLQRNHTGNPAAGFGEAVNLLVSGNAAIASRFWGKEIGVLRPGAAADLAVFDYDPATPFNEESFAGHLVFGMAHAAVDTTVVAGRILMQNRRLTHLDERAIKSRARELAAALWERF